MVSLVSTSSAMSPTIAALLDHASQSSLNLLATFKPLHLLLAIAGALPQLPNDIISLQPNRTEHSLLSISRDLSAYSMAIYSVTTTLRSRSSSREYTHRAISQDYLQRNRNSSPSMGQGIWASRKGDWPNRHRATHFHET